MLALKGAAFALMLAIPLLGVWAASSLAAYWNGPIEATIAAGLLLFPGLPLAWEGGAAWRRRRARDKRESILTFGDRMILRTLALNGAFLAAFLLAWPEAIFTALSTRGDWFLEHVEGSSGARAAVLSTADGLAWLYEAAHENPYRRAGDDADHVPAPVAGDAIADATRAPGSSEEARDPERAPGADSDASPAPLHDALRDPIADALPDPTAVPAPDPDPAPRTWPFADEVHPLVRNLPPDVETSIAAVGQHLAEHAPDPFDRAKAVHDYVATRVAYDVPSYRTHEYPPQDAETVFRTRTAVCAGYAALFESLAREAGLHAEYVVGDARGAGDDPDGEGHAWNAIELEGGWYLVDATWDAGTVRGDTFTPRYVATYFLTPPEAFGVDHFPERDAWQLRARPLTRGEFNRQPSLSPRALADGIRLVSPDRSQVELDAGTFEARVESTRGRFVLAEWYPHGATEGGTHCDVQGTRSVTVRCTDLPRGTFDVWLFTGAERYGHFRRVGSVQVVRR